MPPVTDAPAPAVPSYDSIDAHLAGADFGVFAAPPTPAGPSGTRALPDPTEALRRVAAGYRVVRPLLHAFVATPFLPPTWKAAVLGFTRLLDAVSGAGA